MVQMRRVCGLTLAALLALDAAVSTQQPTFKVNVNLVDVDVTVTDAHGHFVTGLAQEDFEVFEDGKPQQVQTFWYIELPAERAERFAFLGRPVPSACGPIATSPPAASTSSFSTI